MREERSGRSDEGPGPTVRLPPPEDVAARLWTVVLLGVTVGALLVTGVALREAWRDASLGAATALRAEVERFDPPRPPLAASDATD